jgi:hypothetical protein
MYGSTGAIVLTDVDVPSFDNIDLPFKDFEPLLSIVCPSFIKPAGI